MGYCVGASLATVAVSSGKGSMVVMQSALLVRNMHAHTSAHTHARAYTHTHTLFTTVQPLFLVNFGMLNN